MRFKQTKFLLSVALSACFVFGTWAEGKNVATVKNLDLDRFLGTWYEIARLPNSHEKGLVEVTSTMEKNDEGKIIFVKNGFKGSRRGKRTVIKGEVSVPNPDIPSSLKVKVWPFSLDFEIIAIDEEQYQYALVTSKSDKHLWILSKTPGMRSDIYDSLVDKAEKFGFKISRLEKVVQDYNCAVAQK
jgi:lipocalin